MTRTRGAAFALFAAVHLLAPAGLEARPDVRSPAEVIASRPVGSVTSADPTQTSPAPAHVRQPRSHSDWSAVQRLEPGTELQVTTSGQKRVRLYFLGSDDTSLTVISASDRQPRRIAREEVLELRARSRHFGRDLRRGVILIAALGALIGGAFGCAVDECAVSLGVGALVGGSLGAGYGSIIGTLPPSTFERVYRAPYPPRPEQEGR